MAAVRERARFAPRALLLAGLVAPLHPAPAAAAPREVRLALGTTVEVSTAPVAAQAAAFEAIARVEAATSRWLPDGELSRLNDASGGHPSPELARAVAHAVDVARASGGAFDPTLGSSPRLAECAASAGFECVEIDGDVRLRGGARLDLDGLSKGHAADAAIAALREAGVAEAYVDLGGSSVFAFGAPIAVAVSDPEDPTAEPWAVLRLSDAGLATSSQAHRPGHLRDPRTGAAAEAVLGAVVVAPTAAEADALSTALFVLGAPGLELVRRRGAEGLVQRRDAHGRRVLETTPDFSSRHALRAAPGVVVAQ